MSTFLGWLGTFGGAGAAFAVAWFVPWPFKTYALGAAIAVSLASAVMLKIRHDARADLILTIEKEKTDAIDSARAARDAIRDLCSREPAGCVPDHWFRD